MNYDKIISNLFFESDWHISKSIRRKFLKKLKHNKCQNLNKYLLNRFEDYDNYKEILYRIRYKLEERPVCKECGGRIKFVGKGGRFFQTFCSDSCRAHNKDTSEKIRQTNIKNWGTPGMYDSPKYQEKLLKEKGYKNYLQSDEFKEKRKLSLINHYGTTNMFNIPEIKTKIENTCLSRYGVKCVFNRSDIREKSIKASIKANGISKPERVFYEILKEKYKDTKHNYKSKYYPWHCDFYLPKLDLYIECHFSHYHNNKPFDETNIKHLDELKELKQKSLIRKQKTKRKLSQYDMIIYTWTDLDVRKRETAKKNGLNFIEFYTLEEAKEWINSLNKS